MSNDVNNMVAAMYGLPVFQTSTGSGRLRIYAGGALGQYLETLEHAGYITADDFASLRKTAGSSLSYVHGSPVMGESVPELRFGADMPLIIEQCVPAEEVAAVEQQAQEFLALARRQTVAAYEYITSLKGD